jgi:gliding motility-associated-like protein
VVLSNTAGCDSTVTLNLTITNSNTGTDVITSCDSYTWIDGNTYTSSNNSATVVLSNAAGCDSTVTLDLTINNTPSFTVLGTDPSVCNANDGSITISGLNASTNYMLGYDSLSIVTQIITITTDASGEYIISGLFAGIYANFNIESNNCQFTLSQTVDLNNPGAPSIDPLSNITECDSYILPVITGINLSGNEGYYTQSNGGGIQLISGEVITTSQSIYLYDILGTCADESNFTVTIDNTPSFINPGPQEVCESYSLPLSISGTNLSGSENYYSDLQGNGGTVITDAITSSQTVYIFDVNGACSNEVSFDVTVNDLPTLLNFTGEGIYCEGDVVNNLFAEVSGTPNFTLDYTLDGISNSLNSSISSIDLGNTSGVYILTALNDNYCSVLLNATQTITINSIPDMPIVSQDTSYCENSQVSDFQAFGSFDSYTWYSDEALSQVIGNSETYTPSNSIGTTTYYVTGTENGCESLPSAVTITFENCDIIIPTAFTPNDDSVNDTWEIGNIDDIYPSNVVSIYNRWGSKVFESTSGTYNDEPWSGNYNEKKLPVGSYYYIIEFNDNYTPNATGIVSIIND